MSDESTPEEEALLSQVMIHACSCSDGFVCGSCRWIKSLPESEFARLLFWHRNFDHLWESEFSQGKVICRKM